MSDKVSRLRNYLSAPVGTGLLMQGLSKIAPGLSPFVQGALATGYTADAVLDFIRDKYQSPSEKRDRAQLESRASQGVARPDEQAALARHEQSTAPIENASQIARFGLQAAGGLKATQEAGQQQQMQREQHETELANQEQAAAFERERQVDRETERRNAAQEKKQTALRKEATSERRYQEGLKRKDAAAQQRSAKQTTMQLSPDEIQKIDTFVQGAIVGNPPNVVRDGVSHFFGKPQLQAYEQIKGPIGAQRQPQQGAPQQNSKLQQLQFLLDSLPQG